MRSGWDIPAGYECVTPASLRFWEPARKGVPMDVFFVLVTLAFFVISSWYTRGCDKLVVHSKED